MFAVPLISLVALWAFSASLTVPSAISNHTYSVSTAALDSAAVATVTYELPTERAQTYAWLLSGRKTSEAPLLATRKTVDQSLPAAEVALQAESGALSASETAVLHSLLTDLQQLGAVRKSIDAGKLSPAAAFQAYDNIVDTQFQSYYTGTQARGSSLATDSVGALSSAYSLEMASREIAVADTALSVTQGTMSPAARALFTSSAAQRQSLLNAALGLLSGQLLAGYTTTVNSPMYKQFTAMEQQIEQTPDNQAIAVNAKDWEAVSAQYAQVMQATQTANGPRLEAASSSNSSRLLTEAILAGGVGLAAVVVSIFLMLWFGRKVTGDLTGLYNSVRGMAEERLPRVVERLRRGDDVDVAAESPTPAGSSIDEISQIARSFGTVQEAAVEAAVEQARLRKGVNQVFLNISMRNQSLLHRQLSMLDSMERRTSDPGSLADLFRLDHLTTRMRRHAEGLIILSGSTPGRGWRDPVPVVDVLRAAVAEVEDYVRVDVLSESRDLVAGNAVNDLIHLVAELVENATVFSPPNTRIEVRADRAGTGLVAEIEDRGLGLSPDELADINRRLASPPEFDLANSDQLGLFVVSRLAVRHAVKVSLRQSVYGGTTAILVLPFGVIVREEEAGLPAGFAGTGDGQPAAAALPPGGSADPSPSGPLPVFGATGRHRLAAAATGRRPEIPAAGQGEERDLAPAPRPLPRPPWELDEPRTQPQLQAQAQTRATETETTGRPPWDAPWPDAFSRGPAGQPAAAPNPGSQPAVSRNTGSQSVLGTGSAGSSHLGMPVRVPQASLAPQLKGRRERDQQAAAASQVPDIDERSPDATRSMMDLMQQGWERGRADNLDDPASGTDNGTER
ncbi:MAG TPA: nitrate- and nitrite sensing domain-containing protein [Trebonia sp.]